MESKRSSDLAAILVTEFGYRQIEDLRLMRRRIALSLLGLPVAVLVGLVVSYNPSLDHRKVIEILLVGGSLVPLSLLLSVGAVGVRRRVLRGRPSDAEIVELEQNGRLLLYAKLSPSGDHAREHAGIIEALTDRVVNLPGVNNESDEPDPVPQ